MSLAFSPLPKQEARTLLPPPLPQFFCFNRQLAYDLFPSLSSLQVNPEILGGLVVEIGDRTIDYSVSAKITKLNKLLTDTV